jgi:hypothetical protein
MTIAPALVLQQVDVESVVTADGPVARWEATGGTELFGFRTEAWGWVVVPGVAAYRFGESGDVVAVPDRADGARIEDVWLRWVLPLVVQARGIQVLRASAVVTVRGVVALCGRTGAGKSTLATALAQRGLAPAADDALPFELDPGEVTSTPLPFRLRPAPISPRVPVVPEIDPSEHATPIRRPLAALVLLDPWPPGGDAPATPCFDPLLAADAFGAVLPHAYCFDLEQGKRELVSDYAELVRRVPAFRLSYEQEPDRVGDTADAIEAGLAG